MKIEPAGPSEDEQCDRWRVEREVKEGVELLCRWLGVPAYRARILEELRRDPALQQRLRAAANLTMGIAMELEEEEVDAAEVERRLNDPAEVPQPWSEVKARLGLTEEKE